PQGTNENGPSGRLQNLTVLIGTDTFPNHLYVQDAHGDMMHVRLAASPILPFQPGDVISITGMLLSLDGEATIDHAIARLTDILPASAPPKPTLITETDIKTGKLTDCVCARIQGLLTEVAAKSLTLDINGTQIAIPLAGRKEFNVESTRLEM